MGITERTRPRLAAAQATIGGGLAAGIVLLAVAGGGLNWEVSRLGHRVTALETQVTELRGGRPPALAAQVTSSPVPLVIICQQQPCAGQQELLVQDPRTAPIFGVGENGGAATYGDNLSVYGPGSVFNPAIVLSWTSPDGYADARNLPDICTAPGKWIEPGGTWICKYSAWARIGA